MLDRLRGLHLPVAEREEAREKRRADRVLRREAANERKAQGRAAALEAEARRHSNVGGASGGGGVGGGNIGGGAG
jgi:hypothetical protein